MKKTTWLLMLLLMVTSCSKKQEGSITTITKKIPDDPGCISRIWKNIPFPKILNSTDSLKAVQLFRENNIPFNTFVIMSVSYEIIGTDMHTHVLVFQYINDQLLLGIEQSYFFKNEQLASYDEGGLLTTSLDTVPSLRLSQLRTLFLTTVKTPSYKDTCLVAQFGYYSIHPFTADTSVKLVKAWEVHSKDYYYPVVYVTDDGNIIRLETGSAILRQ
jgi:hypothetical protein